MIPKIIHYCWFGGNPLPESVLKCIDSWKKYCPDYEIKQWNEENYDYKKQAYTLEAFEAKKWAFVSDFARLDIIFSEGGIYLDTDVELVKNLDSLLENKCFLAIEQPSHYIATGLGFGAEKGNERVKEMLDEYGGAHFKLADGIYDTTVPCPARNTAPFYKYGFNLEIDEPVNLGGAMVYPPEYFCPFERKINELKITKNTYSIHHYDSSWITDDEKDLIEKVNEYGETHSEFATKLYKNKLESITKYGNSNIISLTKIIIFKAKKKIVMRKGVNQ